MKKVAITFILMFLTLSIYAQSLLGAWEATFKDKEGIAFKSVVIFSEEFQVVTWYNAETGAFHGTKGGTWSLEGNLLTEKVAFDSKNLDSVGEETSFEIELTNNTLKIMDNNMVWHKIDAGIPGNLSGAWLISGRKMNDVMQAIDTNRPRKTMKILSGTRFQWIAYNTEPKQFMATGGGTYTTKDGKYTEIIKFFSRDSSRVGASLEFNYVIKDTNWEHSGYSSKGDPLYEIWTLRD